VTFIPSLSKQSPLISISAHDNMPLLSLMNPNSSGQKPKRRRRKINPCGHNKNPRLRQRRRRHEKNIRRSKYKHVHNHNRPTKALGPDHKPRKKSPTNGRNNPANRRSTLPPPPPPPQPTINTSSTQINTSCNECHNGCSNKLCVRLADDMFLPRPPPVANTPSPPLPSPRQKKVQHAVVRTELRFSLCTMKLQLQLLLLLPVTTVCANATNGNNDDTDIYVICGLVALIAAGGLMAKRKRSGEVDNDSNEVDEELGASSSNAPTNQAAPRPTLKTCDTCKTAKWYGMIAGSNTCGGCEKRRPAGAAAAAPPPPVQAVVPAAAAKAQAATQQSHPAQASSGLSLKFPPEHSDFTSDSTDSNSGVLFREKKGNETIFWVVDKGLIPEFMSCEQNKGVTLRFVPYSSKEGWWEKYPMTPLIYDILPCPQEEDSKFRWKVVIPDKTLDNYLSQKEKNCFPRATLLALQHFKMSVVTSDDIQAFTHHSQRDKYHEGYPCILCTCCDKKLFYDSAKKSQDMISGGIIKHLLECKSFGQKAELTRLQVRLQTECKNADYLEGCSQYVSVRLGRLSMGNSAIYNHQAMIDRAKEVNDLAIKKGIKKKDSKNHVPVYEIYQEAEVKNLIYEIFAAKLAEKDYTLKETIDLFKTVKGPDGKPIDITIFRDDWEQRFNEKVDRRHTQFHLKLCFLYMMRYKQHGCPGCDTLPDDGDTMFGGDGESNHVEADGDPSKADKKSFDLSYKAAQYEMSRLVAEIGESQKECKRCHNHFGSTKPYWDLDPECHGNYSQLEGVHMYSDVQATPECQRVHDVVDKLIDSTDLNKVSYSDLEERFDKIQRYDFRDITLFREPEWRDADARQRTIYVKQIEYYYEKRSIGGCFLCDHSILNGPARDFCSVDGHHVDPEGKDRNPSECVMMDLEEGRLERRKCCPLCRPCHVKVHHVESKEEEFNTQLEDKKYEVKSSFEVAKKQMMM